MFEWLKKKKNTIKKNDEKTHLICLKCGELKSRRKFLYDFKNERRYSNCKKCHFEKK